MSKNNFRLILFYLFSLLLIFTSTVFAQNQQKQNILDITLHYKSGEITLVSMETRQGYLPDYFNQPDNGYTMQVLDKSSIETFKVKFNFPLQIISENFGNATNTVNSNEILDETDQTITIPALPEAQMLIIFDPDGKKILEQDLSVIVNPNLTSKTPTAAQKIPEALKSKNWLIFGGIFLGVLIIALAGFMIYKKIKNQNQQTPPTNINNNQNNINKPV